MRSFLLWCSPLLFVFACVDDAPEPTPFAPDAGSDAGTPSVDAGSTEDASTDDGGGTTPDAGNPDAGEVDGGTVPSIEPPLLAPTLWFDARKIAPGSGPSKTWKDQSGNGFDATGSVALSLEPSGLNGLPSLFFPGETAQALEVPASKFNFQIGNGFAIFVVAQFSAPVTPRTAQAVLVDRSRFVSLGTPRLGTQLIADSGLTKLTAGVYTTAAATTVDNPIPNATTAAHVYAFSASKANGITSWVDGVSKSVAGTITPQDFSDSNTAPFSIGGYSNTDAAQFTFAGHAGEVLVYNRALTSAEVEGAITKLKTEWGIP